MTSWGCTPTCRGFDHFFGYYDADENYYTHCVGARGFKAALDLRNDTAPAPQYNGSYSTELYTAEHIRWLQHKQAGPDADKPSFAYLAHQAVHGPVSVSKQYMSRNKCSAISVTSPTRKML